MTENANVVIVKCYVSYLIFMSEYERMLHSRLCSGHTFGIILFKVKRVIVFDCMKIFKF